MSGHVDPKYLFRDRLVGNALRTAELGDPGETPSLPAGRGAPFDEHDTATAARHAGFPPDWATTLEVACSS